MYVLVSTNVDFGLICVSVMRHINRHNQAGAPCCIRGRTTCLSNMLGALLLASAMGNPRGQTPSKPYVSYTLIRDVEVSTTYVDIRLVSRTVMFDPRGTVTSSAS